MTGAQYGRFEVLAGFTNATFLLFVATFELFESVHDVYGESHEGER